MRGLLIAAAALTLAGTVQAQPALAPADYAEDAIWLCRPGRSDACSVDLTATVVEASGALRSEPFTPAENPAVDCFYLYPTVSNDAGDNSDLAANAEEQRVIASQAARFGAVCRVYAPLYRQITLTALRRALAAGRPVAPEAGALAYADAAAAFRHYIAHENGGRPFVLIGHSQGARMLQLILQREIDGTPLQRRLLSAMLIGVNTNVPRDANAGGDSGSIPLCRSPSQSGCVISYVSFRANAPPPPGSRFGVASSPDREVACTNPAALAGGEAPLNAYLGARGAGQSSRPAPPWVVGGPDVTTPFVRVPDLLSARCVNDAHGSYLAVTVHGDPSDPRVDDIVGDVTAGERVLPDWGLHLIDVSIAQGDLIAIVRRQSEAYFAR